MRAGVGLVWVVGLVGCAGDPQGTCETEGCEGSSTTAGDSGAVTGGDDGSAGSGTGDGDGDGDGTGTDDADGTGVETDTGTTGAPGCRDDRGCDDPAAPFCVDSVCEPCSATADANAACAGADASAPLCIDDVCVACTRSPETCTDTTPICDDSSGACVGCTEHAQCPDSGCHAFVGSCIEPTTVLYVDGNAAPDGDGTPDLPFQTISDAVAAVPDDAQATILVEENVGLYNEAVTVDGGRVLAIFGNGGSMPRLRSPLAAPALLVSDASTVYLDHIEIPGHDLDDNVRVTDGGLDLRNCILVDNEDGRGIDAANAELRLIRTEITLMDLGAISAVGSTVDIETSLVAGNGTFTEATTGLFVEDSTFTINYSSIVNNFGGGSMGGPVETTIECRGDSDGLVRNSILIAPDPEQIDTGGCPMLVVDNSAVDTMDLDGSGSMVVPYDTGYFVNPFAPNFHLDPAFVDSPLQNLASWQDGDPATDIDGDPRPDEDGTPDWAGYDVPQ